MRNLIRGFVVVSLLTLTSCSDSPLATEAVTGKIYVTYPKADIVAMALPKETDNHSAAAMICTDSGPRFLFFKTVASTNGGPGHAEIESDTDLREAMSCGKALTELRRLAEIGAEYDYKRKQLGEKPEK